MSMSHYVGSEAAEHQKSTYPSVVLENVFCFKFMDLEGHVHRFNCGKCAVPIVLFVTRILVWTKFVFGVGYSSFLSYQARSV